MLLNRLIPKALKNDLKAYRSSRLIILIDVILLCLALLFAPLYWWIGFHEGAYIMMYTVVNALIFIGLMYYTHKFHPLR